MGWEKLLSKFVQPYFNYVSLPSLNVGMDKPMWGISLWILVFILEMAAHHMKQNPS